MAAELVAFGDISVDISVRVPNLPAADEKLWVEVLGEYPGGMGANVAAAFAALGGRAALVASVGDDERGARSLEDLRNRGVDVSAVERLSAPTFWTLALLDPAGEKSLLQFATPALWVPWDKVDWAVLDGAAYAHTIAEEGDGIPQLIREARRRGVKISVDVEPVADGQQLLEEVLPLVDVVFATPAGVRSIGAPEDVDAAAAWVLSMGPRVVAITLGARGCVVSAANGDTAHIAGIGVAAVDTTGAGDCYAGAFLLALTRGRTVTEAARIANAMAALSTTGLGSRGRVATKRDLAELSELKDLSLEAWLA